MIVAGAGAAGLIAAGYAAKQGAEVTVLEKNKTVAKKIRISGKGRCNLTNAGDLNAFIASYPGNGKFLYSALNSFTNWDLLDLFHSLGVETKTERGDRIFPVSDDANQIADALYQFVTKKGVMIRYNTPVSKLLTSKHSIKGVKFLNGELEADSVIVTTGGASYPRTGSNGDGYALAKAVGHTIRPIIPALVPLRTKEPWVQEISGLSLRNVAVTVGNGTTEQSLFGEMQFAHFGVTGPIVLTLSSQVGMWLRENSQEIRMTIDLKPALSRETLDARVRQDFQHYARKQLCNGLNDLLPRSLIPILIQLSGISPEKKINQISRQERSQLVQVLKALPLTITSTLPIAAAIVTAGGIDVTEVNPKTMESKYIKGLYFAGEVLDIDGITGGFNLQAAFSTGYLAGIHGGKG